MEKFNFKLKQWVLVRQSINDKWDLARFSYYDNDVPANNYRMIGGGAFHQCIPFEGNEHLLGTNGSYARSYVPDGDFVNIKYETGNEFLAIYCTEDARKYLTYFFCRKGLWETGQLNGELPKWDTEQISPATEEEKQMLLAELDKMGGKWNPEKKKIEDIYQPKDGDFVYVAYNGWNNMKNELLFISKEDGEHKTESYTMYDILEHQIRYDRYVCEDGHILSIRPATEEEKQLLLDALHKEGNDCESKKEIVEYRWKPKDGEIYWIINNQMGAASITWDSDHVPDVTRYVIGNCFRTEAEALAMADKIKELLKGGKE